MSENESHHHGKNEIIIIKRHADHEDGHHGSAWKIAYADFMTAMMAFFLVMWLVNAANEKTKASVASYFNPIKLTDDQPAERNRKQTGKDTDSAASEAQSKETNENKTAGEGADSGQDKKVTSGEEAQYSEADYFENPYSVLSEIAQEVGQQANISAKGEGGAQQSGPATGADGGQAYRDPFDPDFWTQQIEVSKAQQEAGEAIKEAEAKAAAAKTGAADAETARNEAEKTEAEKLQAEIVNEIKGVDGKLAEGLSVTPSEGGLLVSLMDQADTQMFSVGSAVPKRDLVLAMEKIGKILATRKGQIAIRGHTDARPYKDGNHDNWRLSTDRAQSAYYMLIHGGLDEKRVGQVSGFADRRLKVPADPLADANRRIEILIQADQG